MSIQLSKGEKIIKEYDYAKTKKLFKTTDDTLIVTNKRIIHRSESHGVGSETIGNSEMPIKNANYVTTFYGKKSRTRFLILGVISAIIAIILMIAAGSPVFGVMLLLLAVAFICTYIFKKIYICTCLIGTETRIVPAFSLGAVTYSLLGRRASKGGMLLKIRVNNSVAKQLTEELGSIISDINAGVYNEEEDSEK